MDPGAATSLLGGTLEVGWSALCLALFLLSSCPLPTQVASQWHHDINRSLGDQADTNRLPSPSRCHRPQAWDQLGDSQVKVSWESSREISKYFCQHTRAHVHTQIYNDIYYIMIYNDIKLSKFESHEKHMFLCLLSWKGGASVQ